MSSPTIFAALVAATGFWTISAWTVLTSDSATPREFWTVTSSERLARHPTLVRAAVPRALAAAKDTRLARVQQASLASMKQ